MRQGTQEWLNWRENYYTASQSAAVVGESPFFPKTPFQLYQLRTGQKEVEVTPAMTAGNEFEPVARDMTNLELERNFQPETMDRGIFAASLDGLDGDAILEIKCVQSTSPTWKKAQNSDPGHYIYQLAHQLYVSQAEKVYFAVFAIDKSELKWFEVDAQTLVDIWGKVLEPAWLEFDKAMNNFEAPKLLPQDYTEREDSEWKCAVNSYLKNKEAAKKAKEAEDKSKQKLIELAGEQNTKGAGVSVYQVQRKGAVDYRKVPELNGVNLDSYRKKSSSYWAVR